MKILRFVCWSTVFMFATLLTVLVAAQSSPVDHVNQANALPGAQKLPAAATQPSALSAASQLMGMGQPSAMQGAGGTAHLSVSRFQMDKPGVDPAGFGPLIFMPAVPYNSSTLPGSVADYDDAQFEPKPFNLRGGCDTNRNGKLRCPGRTDRNGSV